MSIPAIPKDLPNQHRQFLLKVKEEIAELKAQLAAATSPGNSGNTSANGVRRILAGEGITVDRPQGDVTVSAIPTASQTPWRVPAGETYTVGENKQVVLGMTLRNYGVIINRGFLVEV